VPVSSDGMPAQPELCLDDKEGIRLAPPGSSIATPRRHAHPLTKVNALKPLVLPRQTEDETRTPRSVP